MLTVIELAFVFLFVSLSDCLNSLDYFSFLCFRYFRFVKFLYLFCIHYFHLVSMRFDLLILFIFLLLNFFFFDHINETMRLQLCSNLSHVLLLKISILKMFLLKIRFMILLQRLNQLDMTLNITSIYSLFMNFLYFLFFHLNFLLLVFLKSIFILLEQRVTLNFDLFLLIPLQFLKSFYFSIFSFFSCRQVLCLS